ncbi:unnamed protein product [Protopolystoma xenopodis]|uniref:Uncharacterized protein n=1 Tax=Protopolystoma xenopodis TaxID=117903 RepID=A0A448WXK0_9PLAT|nr:unnamed protein product [Protopolystoma xenopodis]
MFEHLGHAILSSGGEKMSCLRVQPPLEIVVEISHEGESTASLLIPANFYNGTTGKSATKHALSDGLSFRMQAHEEEIGWLIPPDEDG